MTDLMDPEAPHFTKLVDLACDRLGGKVLEASDDFFAEKENLIKPGRGVFIADKYTDRGKWMDGWESRRKRTQGHDWCILQLGLPGVLRGVDIDTNHFTGNHPPFASIDALEATTSIRQEQLSAAPWVEVLPHSALNASSHNYFAIHDTRRWTHLRLNIFPDGGVARLKVYGFAKPDWNSLGKNKTHELSAVQNGGLALSCSDMFYSSMNNLLMPGRSVNMGDGWETKRRRGPGHDWVILKLGHPGMIEKIEIDTNHFKGNYPDTCTIEACLTKDDASTVFLEKEAPWSEILPKTKLSAHTQHFFQNELKSKGPFSHFRLNIFPDGGVSRFRIFGTPKT